MTTLTLRGFEYVRQRVLELDPARVDRRAELASTLNNLGWVIASTGRKEEARDVLRRGATLLEQCVADQPNVRFIEAGRLGEADASGAGRRRQIDELRRRDARALAAGDDCNRRAHENETEPFARDAHLDLAGGATEERADRIDENFALTQELGRTGEVQDA